MKLQKRNLTKFEYLPYTGVDTDLNDDNEHTGEFHHEYGTPIEMEGNISSPSGHTNQTFYGEDIQYTHTLVLDNPNAKIDEYGLVQWKDATYEITAVRPSLNVLSVALRKRTVDHAPPPDPDPEQDAEEEFGGDA